MNGKIALVVGAAVGYVVGTRDGRGRYEQLKSKAEGLWQDPKVQDKVSQATHKAQEKVSSVSGSGTSTSGGGTHG